MDIQNILPFYLVGLVCYSSFLIVAIIQENKEIMKRAFTLLFLLHLTLFAIYQGVLGWDIFVGCALTISIYELTQNYDVNKIVWAIASLIIFIVGLYTQNQFIEFAAPGFIIMSFITFNSSQELVRKKRYLF
ncbi:MAG: hypothetical protein AAGD25_32645 [Cyanobacteria bacterium P01_F01_bin.150]